MTMARTFGHAPRQIRRPRLPLSVRGASSSASRPVTRLRASSISRGGTVGSPLAPSSPARADGNLVGMAGHLRTQPVGDLARLAGHLGGVDPARAGVSDREVLD